MQTADEFKQFLENNPTIQSGRCLVVLGRNQYGEETLYYVPMDIEKDETPKQRAERKMKELLAGFARVESPLPAEPASPVSKVPMTKSGMGKKRTSVNEKASLLRERPVVYGGL